MRANAPSIAEIASFDKLQIFYFVSGIMQYLAIKGKRHVFQPLLQQVSLFPSSINGNWLGEVGSICQICLNLLHCT